MRQSTYKPVRPTTQKCTPSANQVAMPYELPLLDSEALPSPLDDATRKAYSSILSHGQWAAASTGPRQTRDRKLTCARVLGRLLLDAPSTRARDNVVEVNACQDDNDRLYKFRTL